MAKIIGNVVGVPNPKPDWNQTDETKANFIKNKPSIGSLDDLATTDKSSLVGAINEVVSNVASGSGITVDSELLGTSTNPVQNKVVKEALDKKVDYPTGNKISCGDYEGIDYDPQYKYYITSEESGTVYVYKDYSNSMDLLVTIPVVAGETYCFNDYYKYKATALGFYLNNSDGAMLHIYKDTNFTKSNVVPFTITYDDDTTKTYQLIAVE